MARLHSFQFTDEILNNRLTALLKKEARDRHTVDEDGVVHYSHDEEDFIGNDLICSVRGSVFPSWQIISFPKDWTESYQRYMTAHNVPFRGEVRDGQLRFLIPRNYRPHSWKLKEPDRLRKRNKTAT